jgi:hypothetical protein
MNEAQGSAGEAAEKAAGGGKAGAWGAFLASAFTLVASGLGGAAGAGSRARAVAEHEPIETRPPVPQRT